MNIQNPHPKDAARIKSEKLRAVNLALLATILLSVLKLGTAAITGSVGVLSEGIHSALDLLSSIFTRISVSAASAPADEHHPFGHGKFENISALFEALLLVIAGIYILYECFMQAHQGKDLEHLPLAIGVIIFSMIINLFVFFQNKSVGHEHESVAIETNSFHFLTDFFSSGLILISLLAVHYTQWLFLDIVGAVLVSLYIFWISFLQIKRCIVELSDQSLPNTEVHTIENILKKYSQEFLDYHDLKTRKVGAVRHMEMHLTVCSELSVFAAHKICDKIEDDLEKTFMGSLVSIHIEPCDHHDSACKTLCARTKNSRTV